MDKTPVSKIADLRKKKGLTQRDLSFALDVTESTIANWETGRSGLKWLEFIAKMCEVLECEVGELIDYQEEMVSED